MPRPGDRVRIERDHLKGVEGVVIVVWSHDVASISIAHNDANDYIRSTFKRSPDGTYHTIASFDEFHVLDRVKGVY